MSLRLRVCRGSEFLHPSKPAQKVAYASICAIAANRIQAVRVLRRAMACRARPSNSRADSVAFERRRQKPIGHAPMHLLGLVALGYMWDAFG